jgi:hypothetical protein
VTRLMKWLAVLVAPLLLASCILTPAKFVSTLDVRADRTFTFTYVGEVQLARTKTHSSFGLKGGQPNRNGEEAGAPTQVKITARSVSTTPTAKSRRSSAKGDAGDTPDEAAQLQSLAEELSKEYGFRSVKYVGNRKLAIDYSITGKLDHGFIFPFNPEADVLLPFVTIELRGNDRVRIKAPGYANDQNMSASMSGFGLSAAGADAEASKALDGVFMLTTNAIVVSQNQEEGAQTQPDGSKKISWRANAQTREAPLAVLQLDALP